MTWTRVAALEWRRTGAVFVAVALALTGVGLVVSKQKPVATWASWSSTVAGALELISSYGIVLGPVVATVAAWVAGRERRRRMGELLASTARPSWQRRLATSGTVAAALLLGWSLCLAVVLAAIFPSVSYWGGRWWATLLLLVLGVLLCAALGAAAGRWVPGRLVPPALGIALYVCIGVPLYLDRAWVQMVPFAHTGVYDGERLEAAVIPLAAGWAGAVVVLVGMLAVARRRHWRVAAGAAAVALVCGAVLQVLPHLTGARSEQVEPVQRSWVEPDPAATALVCTDDAPVVCVQRVHASYLDQVAPVARRQIELVGRYLPVDRAEELDWGVPPGSGVLPLANLTGVGRPFSARWDEDSARQWADSTVGSISSFFCPQMRQDFPAWAMTVEDTSARLLGRDSFLQDERGAALAARLAADPEQGRAWMASYLVASRRCDVSELERLAAW